MSTHVTAWFHTRRSDNYAPIDSVNDLFDAFVRFTEFHGLTLAPSPFKVWKSFANATCALQLSAMTNNRPIKRTQNIFYRPPDWKDEYTFVWKQYLQYTFNTDAINKLFEHVPERMWELDVHRWRETLGAFLQDAIQPSTDVLEDFGFLVRYEDDLILYTSPLLYQDDLTKPVQAVVKEEDV